ncbi:SnoaL-like domain-containing protein [Pseudonocardia ammonioxydans]|uniref:SnoaL-like domain-containing protein n=1 Tax=Pseudonocardia ammonioxydans TaxID=260086 RepID=A0A1I5HPN2_PSUAM|nr:nuclear transport factor 2 family protein [Pseudonocardia ammonioxydans]SFO50089.1 SnoaL-like domain-containing protein [Pseudonocardia ammonioxydans]
MTLTLQTLSDRTEILELRSRYARALDEQDWDLMRTVFAEDGYADFSFGRPCEGIEEILHGCRSIMEHLDHTQHLLGNHEITVDGDRASGRHKLIGGAYLTTAAGAPSLCEHGEYVDEYVRTADGWRISRLVFSMTWSEGNMGILGAGIEALKATVS